MLFIGSGAATVMFAKNRSDRHNAAVDRGEIRAAPDPHFTTVARDEVPSGLLARLVERGCPPAEVGRVVRFDDGWIVRSKSPGGLAVVIGDDGGWARFEPRRVTDLWAVSEYRAGRGREPVG